MDADVPRIPEKQVLIARGDQHMDEDIKKINEIIRIRKARGTITYGPIAAMDLPEWKDLGNSVLGGQVAYGVYRHENPRCTLQVGFRPRNHKSQEALLRKLTQTTGPIQKSEWDSLGYLFGEAGYARLFTVESVEVADVGGKKVIIMKGQNTEGDQSREKNVYVSLSGDWANSYKIGIGSPADQFDQAEPLFDKALKTVVWKSK